MISVVNGYICTSSCEVASAKQGKDPHAPPGTPPGQSGKADKKSGLDSQPATLLGGALQGLQAANGVTPTTGAAPSNGTQQPLLNLLA